MIGQKMIILEYLSTVKMIVDPFTKPRRQSPLGDKLGN